MASRRLEGIQCVLLDIEGTICPISFVKDTLFPYALKALPAVLRTHWTDPAFQPYITAFPAFAQTSPSALQTHVEDLTARDVKAAPLKSLQGYLWENGYRTGEYATPLFPDVAPRLHGWKDGSAGARRMKVAIYSSGSVFAQKLLMAHVRVTDGEGGSRTEDLQGLVEAWFDTVNAGPKTERASYEKIARDLELRPEAILFASDNEKEVDAALAAGVRAIMVDRPGNAALSEADRSRLDVISSFDEI